MRLLHLTGSLSTKSRLALVSAVFAASYQLPALSQERSLLTLEEIIVTATKKDEVVQDVPSAVNVLTGDRLSELNIFDFREVEKLTPGLSLSQLDPRNEAISLRGISYNPDSNAPPTVVTYFNGVNYRASAMFQSMFDIARIEILRGPQGTLQGETSPSGSIQVYSVGANLDIIDGQVQTTIIDNDGTNTQFGVSIPIIEGTLGIRLAGMYDESDLNEIETLDGRTSNRTSEAARITIGWEPTDDLVVNLMHQYQDSNAELYEIVQGSGSLGTDGGAAAPISNSPDLDYSQRISLQDGNAIVTSLNRLTTLSVDWLAADHLFSLVSGYQILRPFADRDRDLGNDAPGISQVQIVDTDAERKTLELRVTNDEPDAWEYIFGLYYETADAPTFVRNVVRGPLPPIPLAPFGFYPGIADPLLTELDIPVNTETMAIFADNKFFLTDETTLEVGARFQKLITNSETNLNIYPTPADRFIAGLIAEGLAPPSGTPGYIPTLDFIAANVLGIGAQGGLSPGQRLDAWGGAGLPIPGFQADPRQIGKASGTGYAWTGSIKLSHDLDEKTMIYSSLGRGYRPGGSTVSTDEAVAGSGLNVYEEETSNTFEVGFKSVFENGRYQVNGALYYQAYTDFISRNENLFFDSTGDGITNAGISGGLNFNGDVIVRGAEIDFTGALTEGWTLYAALSYSDAKFDGAEQPCSQLGDTADPGLPIRFCTTDGRVGSEPNWSFSTNSEYVIALGDYESYIRANYKFNSSRANELNGFDTGGYGIADLYFGIRADQGWDISLWSKNLFDKDALTSVGNLSGFSQDSSGYRVVTVEQRRLVGITAKYRF